METCKNHVERMGEGLKTRGKVFLAVREVHERLAKRAFNQHMSDYQLFGELIMKADAIDVKVTHMDGNQRVGDSMPLSNFSGGERSREEFHYHLYRELSSSSVVFFIRFDQLDHICS